MSFFCKNAQEEALKEIAKQMRITNYFELLRECHEVHALSDAEYKHELIKLYNGRPT